MILNKHWGAVVFAPMFPPAFLGGGPIRTLDALVREAPDDLRVLVLTSDRDLGGGAQLQVVSNKWVARDRAFVYYMSTNRLRAVVQGFLALRREKPDVLYFNSFFNLLFSIIPQLVSRIVFEAPPTRLLAPRGEFSVGALAIRSRKKRLFIQFYKMLRLDRGVVWHASAEMEALDIRGIWGANAVVLVRENETSLPLRAAAPCEGGSSRLRAIFLGRIVPKKGLLVALKALKSTTAEIQLDIYGSEEDSHYSEECRRAASDAAPSAAVRFLGAVLPEDVRSQFGSYDVMLMPTAGENFGHVIAEALSASCPVMCTDTTPWTDLLAAGAGIIVSSSNPDEWSEAIDCYAVVNAEERLARRLAAGEQYEQWRTEPKGPHILELVKHCGSTE